ncbi:MAG: hypothetical protein Q8941_02150 [Bacteroidota bacterium]|nr:hypothetical protein [Bacteroidota bacterium]
MRVHHTHNVPEPQKLTSLYSFILILMLAFITGRYVIAWLLMKLYEFFIQKNFTL